MFCNKCGKKNDDDALFCEYCGNKLKKHKVEDEVEVKENPKQEEQPKQEEKLKQEEKPKQEEQPKQEEKPKQEEQPKQEEKPKQEEQPKQEEPVAGSIMEPVLENEEIVDVEKEIAVEKKDNVLVRFIKKCVGELDADGPLIKNKFVIICIVITVAVVVACLVIYIVHNVSIMSTVREIGGVA